MPEAVPDLDQLAAAEHDLLAGSQGHRGEQQRGGVVVDDVHASRGRYRAGQCGQGTSTAAGAATGHQIELDVGSATRGEHRVQRGLRQRRAAQVRVHDDTGGIDDGSQARRADRKCRHGVLGDLLRLDLPRARPLLGLGHNGFHQRAAEHALGLGEARIGEQHIGAGDTPSRVTHVGSPGLGGGGRESNPPATESAAQRF